MKKKKVGISIWWAGKGHDMLMYKLNKKTKPKSNTAFKRATWNSLKQIGKNKVQSGVSMLQACHNCAQ